MARLTTPDEASLSSETLTALESVRMNGKLAPVYLQYANSEPDSFKGKKVGLDEATQLAIRRGEQTGDDYLDTVIHIVRAFFTRRGALPQETMQAAASVGLDDASLLDICLAVSTIVFTNISNHVNDTDLSLPPAPPI